MFKKMMVFGLLLLIIIGVSLFESVNEDVDLSQWRLSFIWLAALYFVFKILLEDLVVQRISDSKSRYKLRKTFSLVYMLIFVVVLMRIWVQDPQSLLVAYGLVGAGVAISLQDIFKNFVGGFTLLVNNTYRVGDRIEIDGTFGDVIDISLFYTTLLELREWVDGDQATGRLSIIPNGKALNTYVHNYTKDHQFIWDEISIPITYDSNWQKALKSIEHIVTKHTKDATAEAEQGIARIGEKYYLSKRNTEPSVFVSMTDNWLDFKVRFVTDVRNRRLTNNELTQQILKAILSEDDITIASETLVIKNQ